ncbi:MAG: hypothetical protein JW751_12470, partial [Polyangiaceae bacterium]|nr:hypothetical protein [Polyangiaceae bacterium]
MEQVVLEPVVRVASRPEYRYFAPGSAVVSEGDRRQVFVGGTLVGEFAAGDRAARNVLFVQLCQDTRVHLGRLAKACELSEERVQQLRRKFEQSGLGAVIQIRRGGREPVVTARMRAPEFGRLTTDAAVFRRSPATFWTVVTKKRVGFQERCSGFS